MKARNEPERPPMSKIDAFRTWAALQRHEDVPVEQIEQAEAILGYSIRPYGGDAA